jgi:hypothetical protein
MEHEAVVERSRLAIEVLLSSVKSISSRVVIQRSAATTDPRLLLRIHPVQGSTVVGRFQVVPIAAQVDPGWVGGFDERDLLERPQPLSSFSLAIALCTS